MADDQPDELAPTGDPDPFQDLVLDENFVRGGTFEPPARTRLAIARYSGRETSWRHGGGLHDRSRQTRDPQSSASPAKRGPRVPQNAPSARRAPASSVSEKLPLIVSIVVVAIAAYLMFR